MVAWNHCRLVRLNSSLKVLLANIIKSVDIVFRQAAMLLNFQVAQDDEEHSIEKGEFTCRKGLQWEVNAPTKFLDL